MNKIEMKPQCDIIIPIFNAYDCLSECIDSVIENTDLENNGLIIINDKSTDERVRKLLNKYQKRYPHIKVLDNKENLGFVGTTNKGMKMSKNDVVLLNSDTIVTPKWLEKIKECAYSQEMVATVTPLSNNATLASVPNIFEKNELPKNLSLEEMSKIVEECSYNDYPEIPTAHGFCMYIKRSVLEEVGYFDEKAFGKGYGEENDFCFRCFDYGYSHLLCDNTYIYHKESQSFSKKKYELMKNGEKVLNKRYPEYQSHLRDWCSKPPIKYIGWNIAYAIGKRKDRKDILFLIHDWDNVPQNIGGTTLHAYDLIKSLRNKYNFHVLAPSIGKQVYKLYSYWDTSESEIVFPGIFNYKRQGFYSTKYREMLQKVVEDFSIDLIHIHHMIDHYFDVIDIIEMYKLFSILSVHDLYSMSPNFNLVGKVGQLKEDPTESEKNILKVWHREWKGLYEVVDRVITPSKSTKIEVLKIFENEKTRVIEHGSGLEKINSHLDIRKQKKNFNVAFVGAIGQHKGSEILDYLVNVAKPRDFKIHLFGVSDRILKENKFFVNHGKYKRDDLSRLLNKYDIHLVCLFSLCPETYSYTLTESIASGVPVLGVDIGAIGERIKEGGFGWVIEDGSTKKRYLEKIREILSNPIEYGEVIRNVNKYEIRSIEEMSYDYALLYRELLKNRLSGNYNDDNIKELIKNSEKLVLQVNRGNVPDYSWVFETLKWKIISKIKIPRSIKRLYLKITNK